MVRLHTRDRKIIKEISTRKRRTLLISAAIFISVAGIITLFSLGDILIRQLEKEIDNDDIAMLNTVVIATEQAYLDNGATLERLQTQTNATAIQGSLRATVRWRSDHESYTTATINGYDVPFDDISIEPPRLLEGRYPRRGEVAIELRFATNHDLAVGDTIYFTPSNSPELAYRISGIVFHVYNLSPDTGIYANLTDANLLSRTNGYNLIAARFSNYASARQQADDFSEILLQETSYFPIQFQLQDPDFNPLNEGAQRVSNTLNFLAILSLFISAFSVINVTRKIVGEQKQQIGTLKALGASRLELIYIYVGISFSYGLIGVIPGVVLGVPLGYYLADVLAPEVNTVLIGFELSVRAIAIGIALGLIVPSVAALLPTFFGTRISILDAMTDMGIDFDYQNGIVATLIRIMPIPINVQMGLHNINKKKARLALTIAALTIAVASYVAILSVFNAIDDQIGSRLTALNASHIRSINVPNEQVSDLAIQQAAVSNLSQSDILILPFNNLGVSLMLATVALNNNEAIVSQAYAEQAQITTGDVIRLTIADNSVWFRVVGIAPSQEVQVWVNGEPIGGTSDVNAISDQQMSLDALAIATLNDVSTFDFLSLLRGFRLSLETFRALLSVIAAVIGIVGGLGLATTLSLSVLERQREIGVMRSIGAGSWAIVSQFIIEGLLVGFIAWVIGLPISTIIANRLIETMGLSEQFTSSLRFDAALTGLIAVMVIASVASIWPAYIAATRTVSDILRYH